MKLFNLVLPALMLFSANTYASCGKDTTLFFCNTVNGKQIEVCDTKKTIAYSFGRPKQKPELAINVLRDQVSTYQWAGVSQTEYYSLDIPNGKTVYHVFWGADRGSSENVSAGVEVMIEGNSAAHVYCKEPGLISNIMGVNLKPS